MPKNAKGFKITDKIDDVLAFVGNATVTVDGTAAGTAAVDTDDTQLLVVTFTEDEVKNNAEKEIVVTFKAKINVDDTALVTAYPDRTVPNKASYVITNLNDEELDPKDSEEVTVTPPTPNPDEPEIEKKVNDKEHEDLGTIDEEFTYTINTTMPKNAKGFKITDEIDAVLAFVGEVKVTVGEGEEAVDLSSAATKNGQTLTVTFTEEQVKANEGKAVVVTFDAKINVDDAALVAKYTDRTVPNTASYTITNLKDEELDPKESEEVTVTPPTPTPDEPEIEKLVNDKEHEDLGAIGEVFTYTINTTMPKNAKGFKITDEIDAVLAFVGEVKVTVGEGEEAVDLSSAATKNGQTLTVTFTEEQVKANEGKAVVVTFDAKINVDDAALVAKYTDRTVPNTASYTITNLKDEELDPKESEEVTVTPPTPETPVGSVVVRYVDTEGNNIIPAEQDGFSPVKTDVETGTEYTTEQKDIPGYEFVKVNTPDDEYDFDGDDTPSGTVEEGTKKVTYIYKLIEKKPVKKVNKADHADLVVRNEEFTYTISQFVPANAVKIGFVDVLEDVLKVVGVPTIDANGADIRVDKQTVTADITGEAYVKALRGKTVTLTIRAKIREGTDLSKYTDETVPNEATVKINDNGQTTNVVTVKPPVPVGSVVVRHVDTDGKEIRTWDVVKENVNEGTEYTTTPLNEEDIPGYVFIKVNTPDDEYDFEGDDAPNGTVVRDKTTKVTYIYEKIREPEKRINGSKNLVTLADRDEIFTYSISQKLPMAVSEVTFTDTLEDVLQVVGYDTTDGDAIYKVSIKSNGNAQTITAYTDNAGVDAGKVVTFTFRAKIRDDVSDEYIVEKYGEDKIIPNEAKVTIGNYGQGTNIVNVTPPGKEEPPVGSVVVRYITENGEYLEADKETGWLPVVTDKPGGTSYDTEKKTFEGYTFLKMADNSAAAKGVTVNDTTLEVTYVYAPVGSVQVRHVTLDEKGEVDEVLKDWEYAQKDKPGGTRYTTYKENFDGYHFIKMKDDSAGSKGVVVSGETLYVTYVYDVNPVETGSVKVHYITDKGKVLEDWSFVKEDQPDGTSYTTEQKDFSGYTFVEIPDYSADASGSVKSGETLEVTYVYQPVGSVKVRYITKDGKILDGWRFVQENKPDGTEYTTEQRDFPGYTFIEVPDYSAETNGNVKSGETLEVTYVYQPAGSVKVHYITEDGKVLEDWSFVQENAAEGTSYTTEQKGFEGYEFVEVPAYSAAVNGSVKAFDILEVTYVYRPARKNVEFSKTDFVTGDELAGATLSILDATGTKVLHTWTTVKDETGKVNTHFVPLEPGDYILREDLAPVGYDKATDVKFTVTNDGVAQKVGMVDTSHSVHDYTSFDVTIDKKWVDHTGTETGWPEGVDKITVKLQYLDKEKGWTDFKDGDKLVTLDITKGNKGTFPEIPAMIDGEMASYRVVELTKVDGYTSLLLSEDGTPVGSVADLKKGEFDMELINKKNPPKTTPAPDPTPDPTPDQKPETGTSTGTSTTPATRTTVNTPSVPVNGGRVITTPSAATVSKATGTGDNNSMVLWIVLAAAAAAAGAAVAVRSRRKD